KVPGVYAVGDIVPGMQLAHRGFQQGIFVAEDIAGLHPTPIDENGIPRVTYSEPEVASVGLSEDAAKTAYGADFIESLTYDLSGNGKSQILKTSGFVKVVRRKDGPVVGLHLVGSRVGELIGEAQLIYNWEAFPQDVAGLVHMHPTQNEALGEAHLALAGKPLHAHS
ncbi:MAG: dihydrolipoyl dehydrogenase, partial [Nocardioidaceae bacterium]|nr:dihydrolipoyl dehydrogenase [Nocardioidaceae bacterium]